MTAKEYLLQYRQIENRIDGKNERVRELRLKATSISISTGEHVQTSKTNNQATLIIERYLMLADEIDAESKGLMEQQMEIQATINKLEDHDQKTILELCYINGLPLAKIAEHDKTRYSYKQICRIHGKALENIKKVLENAKDVL